MYTSIDDCVKDINAIKAQIAAKDKELDGAANARDYDRISNEISHLYTKIETQARQLAGFAGIASDAHFCIQSTVNNQFNHPQR